MTLRTDTTNELKRAVRAGYAWPGGYELIAFTRDGGTLCMPCVRDNWRSVCHETLVPGWEGCGWSVQAIDNASNYDPELPCDHCGRELSPYGDE